MIIFDYSFQNTGGGGYIRAKTCGTQHSNFFKKIFFRQYSEVFYRACVSHIPFFYTVRV